jgi:hypothetical protein
MTDSDLLIALAVLVLSILLIRGAYRRLVYTRAERAFLALAATRSVPTAQAMDYINLARAKGTSVMQEVAAEADVLKMNELAEVRRQAAFAVMERAARDERRRLISEGDLSDIGKINEAADTAGTAMLNQYAERGGPLGDDSPLDVAALKSLIDNCNDDLRGVPDGEQYVTQVGRVVKGQ